MKDRGGNILESDSRSAVFVDFANNPSDASLPASHTLQPLLEGHALFTSLSIDNVGLGYILRFTFHAYNWNTALRVPTSVSVESASFDVLPGPPYKLVVTSPAYGAWAGGTAFTFQPSVELRDAGGNVISEDSESW